MADCHSVARKLEDASTSSPLHRWPDVGHWQQVARARRKVAVDVEPTVTSSALAGRAVARARHVDEDGRVVRAGCEEHVNAAVACRVARRQRRALTWRCLWGEFSGTYGKYALQRASTFEKPSWIYITYTVWIPANEPRLPGTQSP